MDSQVIARYRQVYADCAIDRAEASELTTWFAQLNPPPDKLTWLRSTAFRIACDSLGHDDESLLRTVNYIAHAIEQTCME